MRNVDIIVIGAGIAGVSLAARCVKHARVTVLEAESAPGFHSSGRSVAHAHFGLGDDAIRALTALSMDRLAEIPADGGAAAGTLHPTLHIATAANLDTLNDLERQHRQIGRAIERLDTAATRRIVPILKEETVAGALLDTTTLKLDADAMLQSCIRAVRSGGGDLVFGAPVSAVTRDSDAWRVETISGSYHARWVVNAAGAWADTIAEMAGVTRIGLQPRRRTVISIDGPIGEDIAHWPFTKTVGEGFYVLPEGSGRLLASSMDATPCDPCDAAAEELDIAIAAHRIEEATTLPVRRIHHSWAGLRSFVADERPVVGFAPDAPGFFWFAGQGGFGLQTSPALADLGEALLFDAELPAQWGEHGITAVLFSPGRLD